MDLNIKNFIENGFNVSKWQEEYIEKSISDFQEKIFNLFKDENKLLSPNKKYIFNETILCILTSNLK